MMLRTFFIRGSLFAFVAFVAVAGCSLATSFDDKSVDDDSGTPAKKDSSVGSDSSVITDSNVPETPSGVDPQCIDSATQATITKGLPNTGAFDGVHLCCAGKYIDISSEAHCGGCGVNCKLSPAGAAQNLTCTKVTREDDATKAYYVCEGCKLVGDYGANPSCWSNYCSGSGSNNTTSTAGRCVASQSATMCNETYCQSVGGKCAPGDGVPNRYCQF